MTEATKTQPQLHNGKPKGRLSRLVTGTKRGVHQSWLTSKELAKAPFRCLGRVGFGLTEDVKRAVQHGLPTVMVGMPLATTVAVLGATPAVTLGALTARAAKSCDTILGSVIAGACGFLVATALVVWLYELAVAWTLFEVLGLTARAAESAIDAELQKLAAIDS